MRDDFTQNTKRTLSQRVGLKCSNPDCGRITFGPTKKKDKVANIGVAAHICAASSGGPRYDQNMTSNDRKSINNGIWLCQNCATLIDKDVETYTKELLCDWKNSAEEKASNHLKGIPPKLNNLPKQNDYFTGREDICEEIHKNFQNSSSICLTQKIKGLGGVGKTQMALNYARHYAGEYADAIWILNADNGNTLYNGCFRFLKVIGKIPENCEDTEILKEENIVKLMQNWFNEHSSFLFIYDNYDSEGNHSFIEKYLPKQIGHILITSRNRQIHFGEEINLDVFKIDEALKFLLKRTEQKEFVSEDEEKSATKLAERLGRLPLALEQAGAYIFNSSVSFGKYLNYTDQYELDIFEQDKMSEPKYYNKIVTTTWEISFQVIENLSAKQFFKICAYTAPDNIPIGVFSKNTHIIESELLKTLKEDLKNEFAVDKMIADLSNYSLVTRTGDDFITIHRLVQEVVRGKLDKENDFCFLDTCFNMFYVVTPNDFSTHDFRDFFKIIVGHLQEVAKYYAKKFATDRDKHEKIADFYRKMGKGFFEFANYNDSEEYYKQSLSLLTSIKRKSNRQSLAIATIYSGIAAIYHKIGHYSDALKYDKKALSIREKILGVKDIVIVSNYVSIGLTYYNKSKYSISLRYFQKAYDILEKENKIHIYTAKTFINMGNIYYMKGLYGNSEHFRTALSYYKKSLNILKKLPKEDINTTLVYDAIGNTYDGMKNHKLAIKYRKKVLNIRKDNFGPDSPITAISYDGLGCAIFNSNRHSSNIRKQALELFTKALIIWKKHYGIEHYRFAETSFNIAEIQEENGDYKDALILFEQALNVWEKLKFDKTHPYIKQVKLHIAYCKKHI